MHVHLGRVYGLNLNKKDFFVTSDIHFFHANIIKYSNRPCLNVDDMNEKIIENWNRKIPKNGKVFIIGDLAMGGKRCSSQLLEFLDRMNGQKFLIPGNHDNYIFDIPGISERITSLPQLVEVKIEDANQKIVMCHYALKVWDGSHYGKWMLHGHSHGSLPRDYSIKSIDVGIDCPWTNFSPLSYDDVELLMSEHRITAVDHHE